MKFDAMKDFKDSVMLSELDAITNCKLLDEPCEYSRCLCTELYLVPYTTETRQDPIMRMAMYLIGEAHTISEDGTLSVDSSHVMVLPLMLYDETVEGTCIYKKLGDTTSVKILYAVFFERTTNNCTSRFLRKIHIEQEWVSDISVNMETRTLRQYYVEKYAIKQGHAFNKMKQSEDTYNKCTAILEKLRGTTE